MLFTLTVMLPKTTETFSIEQIYIVVVDRISNFKWLGTSFVTETLEILAPEARYLHHCKHGQFCILFELNTIVLVQTMKVSRTMSLLVVDCMDSGKCFIVWIFSFLFEHHHVATRLSLKMSILLLDPCGPKGLNIVEATSISTTTDQFVEHGITWGK